MFDMTLSTTTRSHCIKEILLMFLKTRFDDLIDYFFEN